MTRHKTKEVRIGNCVIGGNNPIAIQSMTNTHTEDVDATVKQIRQLTKAGCEIIRCAVPTMEAAKALTEIKKQITENLDGYNQVTMSRPIKNGFYEGSKAQRRKIYKDKDSGFEILIDRYSLAKPWDGKDAYEDTCD